MANSSNPVLALFDDRLSGGTQLAWHTLSLLSELPAKWHGKDGIYAKLNSLFENDPTIAHSDKWKAQTEGAQKKALERAITLLASQALIDSRPCGRSNEYKLSDEGKEQLTVEPNELNKDLLADFARSVISDKNKLALKLDPNKLTPLIASQQWSKKVRIVAESMEFSELKKIAPDVLDTVYDCLFTEKRFAAYYINASEVVEDVDYEEKQEYEFNPVWLVVKAGVIYLVATLWDYKDLRHFALHRMAEPKALEKAANQPDITLAEYLKTESFQYPLSNEDLALQVQVKKEYSYLVTEKYLSDDQELLEADNNKVSVKATVSDTLELRKWLLSLGPDVEVIGPPKLRQWMKNKTQRMARLYR